MLKPLPSVWNKSVDIRLMGLGTLMSVLILSLVILTFFLFVGVLSFNFFLEGSLGGLADFSFSPNLIEPFSGPALFCLLDSI